MVEFVTLFLAMVWGPTEVEVSVNHRVAVVELRLDGRSVGRLTEAPWKLSVDFGESLEPHDLEAIALDGKGRILDRTRQWINFGRGLVDARWVVEPGQKGPPKRARLVWESIDGVPPRKTNIRFNEQPLQADADGWVKLPVYAPDEPQSLQADLTFEAGQKARADLVFGGVFGDDVSSELSSCVLLLPAGVELPTPEEASRWIRKEKGSIRVSSVDAGAAFVILVKDRQLHSPIPMSAGDQVRNPAKRPGKLRRQDQLFLMQTSPQATARRPEVALFKPYAILNPYQGKGIFYAARRLTPPLLRAEPQHIFDAVAVSGRLAARSGLPRAVLWMQGPGGDEGSLVDQARVHQYLEALQVPLVTWEEEGGQSLGEAVDQVHRSLDRQTVFWIEGRHLPGDFLLTEAAPKGLRFAGESP